MTDTLTDERLREIEARIDDASNEQDGGLSQAILEANAAEDLPIVLAALRSEREARQCAKDQLHCVTNELDAAEEELHLAEDETLRLRKALEAAEAEVERLREECTALLQRIR